MKTFLKNFQLFTKLKLTICILYLLHFTFILILKIAFIIQVLRLNQFYL